MNSFDFPQSDDLAEILNAPVDTARAAKADAAAEQKIGFVEKCPKCRGTGFVTIGYAHRRSVSCFGCKGRGNKTFKTSTETRAQNRETSQARKERKLSEQIEAFKAEHPAIWAWMDGNTFEVAVQFKAKLLQYGSLLDWMVEKSYKMIAKRDAAIAAAAERVNNAPTVDAAGIDKLKQAFDTAAAYIAEKGLTRKTPKLTIGGVTISPAGATSKNAGALYVKEGETYLGKIANGKLFATRECTPETASKIQAFICSPAEAATVYGQTTGTCCVCNATLKSEWKNRGIGPICAEKFGW